MVIESGLHVSGPAAANCYAKYGNLFNHEAPPLIINWLDRDESVSPWKSISGGAMHDELQNLSICLATPYLPEDEPPGTHVREKLEEIAAHLEQEDKRFVFALPGSCLISKSINMAHMWSIPFYLVQKLQ